MMTREREHHGHRRRSPESERRRRRERRDSREQTLNQLQHIPAPDPYQQVAVRQQQGEGRYYYESQPQAERPSYAAPSLPPQSQYSRSRALSSSGASSSSSTSSSLLNISRDGRRFGFMSFFTAGSEKHKRRVRKKRSRRMFRFGNGSSSSDLSDMAYGKGYIDRRRSRDFTPPGLHQRREGSDRDRPGPPKRAQTDEEIIELGRKFAEIARQQNKEDLRRAGRHKPTALLGAAAALTAFSKTSKRGHSEKGIGSSKLGRHHSSDESDWESASEDESSSEDDGLVYGSATHLPHGGGQPIHISSPPPVNGPGEYEKLLQHKRSIVDPNLFGPVNSLRGHVNTPCGFDKVDRRTVSEGYQLPAATIDSAPIPQNETVSYEGRPMQHVYPVPTSDPNIFKTGRGSVISTDSHGRPAPVPIQHPKPIVPVSSKVFDATDADAKYSGRASSSGTALAGAAAAGLAGAAIANALSDRKDKDDRREDRHERELEREREREREEKRRSKRPEGKYTESIYSESRYGDERDEKRRSKRSGDKYASSIISTSQYGDDREEKRRSKRSDDKYTAEREEKRKSRDDNRDYDRSEGRREKEGSKRDADADREYEREKRRREKERTDEYDHGREYRGNERREDRKKDKERRKEERREEKAIAGRSSDVDVYRRIENPENPSTQGPIDPFQFQVGNSAFTTPQYSNTPVRPLTPSIVTVEREPDFSRFDDELKNPERLSRRDSYERELRDTEAIYDSVKHSTAPIAAGAIGAATAAIGLEEVRGRGRSRSRGGDETSRVRDDNRDVVQDVANILYRRDLLARQAAEERSRSQSPDQSVVEKWKDGQAPAPPEIITPAAKDVPKPKSPYDAPDADVRIDNILSPRDLPVRTNGRLPKSRDPSAERDRPMLNLVRPTPVSTPQPEKQTVRDSTREEPLREEPPLVKESKKESKKKKKNPPLVEQIKSANDVVTSPRGEVVQASSSTSTPSTPTSKAVTWGENQTRRYVVESPERGHGEYSGARVVEPAETPKSKSGKKSGWGILASAIAGSGAVAAASSVLSDSGKDKDQDETLSNVSSSSRRSRDRDSPKDTERDRDETASNISSSSQRSKDRDSPKVEDREEVSGSISSRSRKSRDYEPPEVKDRDRDETFSNVSSSSRKSRDRDASKDTDEISSNISGSSRKSRDSPKGKRQSSVPWDEVEDPPIPGPKPSSPRGVPMPGSFAEDLAFTATIAAGLQDSGFDPNIVINDAKYHRRDSPPNTDGQPSLYQTPFAETVTDLGAYPVEATSSKTGSEHGFILGEVPETPRDGVDTEDAVDLSKLSKKERKKLEKERAARADSFDNYDNLRSQIVVEEDPELSQPISEPAPEEDDWTSSTNLSKKEQKKRDKAARAQLLQESESALSTPRDSEPGTPQPVIEDDEWATSSKLSKKEKKKLEKAAKAKALQEEEVIEAPTLQEPEPQPAEAGTVDEWDATSSKKKSKKDKKKDKAIIVQDDTRDLVDEDSSKISVPVDAYRDIQEEEQITQPEDEWNVPSKKSKKKSKRDSAVFDLPSEPVSTSWADEVEESLPVLSEPQPEDDWSIPSKKSKKKSKRDSEIYDSPSQSIARSEADSPRDVHEEHPVVQQEDEWATPITKKSKKKSKRDSGAYDLPTESATPLEADVSRSIEGEIQAGQPEDEWSVPSKKSKKKSKRDSEIYDSPSRAVAQYEVGESSKTTGEDETTVIPDDGWDAPKKSKKKHSKQDSFATDTTDWTNVPSVVSESMIKSQSTDYFSTAEPATIDDWELPTKKSKKKSKRDSTSYDSPSQTPTGRDEIVESPKTMNESFSDLRSEKNGAPLSDEWDEPKKSKKKSKRDSQIYDSPSGSRSASLSRTQSEISISDKRKSLPASEVGSETSEKKSKKEKRRSLPGGFPDDFDAYDQEDPPDRGRDKYPFLDNDVSSVVSAPLRDRSEKRRSRSRFDDRDDDTKSVASAPGGSRRKDSKSEKDKEKRNSAGPGLFDRFKSSIGIVDDKSSRKDDDKKALKDNAGTLGASVGLLGAAAALIKTQLSPSNATDVPSEKEAHSVPTTPSRRSSSPPPRRLSDSIDPEIVQREIRPAIDPQYGDLLPLPPSPPPGSPLTHETDELPALPESRPETPEHERQFLRDLRKTPSHIRRKSANESPIKIKSPSQSAIPLRFGIGKAKRTSEPMSPGFSRFSPMSSPIAAPIETLSATKARPARPTSWDSTREFKPLYLVEKTSRETVGSPVVDASEILPQLPESDPSSRESPGPEFETREHVIHYEHDHDHEHAQSLSSDLALKLDIPAALAEIDNTQHASQDTTPRAQIFQQSDSFSTLQQAERKPEEPVEPLVLTPKDNDGPQNSPKVFPIDPEGLEQIPDSTDNTTSKEAVGLGLMVGTVTGTGTAAVAMLDESSDRPVDNLSQEEEEEMPEFTFTSSKKSKKGKKGNKSTPAEVDNLPGSIPLDETTQVPESSNMSKKAVDDEFIPISTSKKGKKGKKNKKALDLEAEPFNTTDLTENAPLNTEDLPPVDETFNPPESDQQKPEPDFESPALEDSLSSSKKGKKKRAKSLNWDTEPESTATTTMEQESAPPTDTTLPENTPAELDTVPGETLDFFYDPSSLQQPAIAKSLSTNVEEPILATKKGKKKKGKKSQSWEPEPEPELASISFQDPNVASAVNTSSESDQQASVFETESVLTPAIPEESTSRLNTEIEESQQAYMADLSKDASISPALAAQQPDTLQPISTENELTTDTSGLESANVENTSLENSSAVPEPDDSAPISADVQPEGLDDTTESNNVKSVDSQLPIDEVEASLQPNHTSGESQLQPDQDLSGSFQYPLPTMDSGDNTIDRLAQPPVDDNASSRDIPNDNTFVAEQTIVEPSDYWQQDTTSKKKKGSKDKRRQSALLESDPELPSAAIDTVEEPLPRDVHLSEQAIEVQSPDNDPSLATQPEMEATPDDIWATPVKSGKKGKKAKKNRQPAALNDLGETPQKTIIEAPLTGESSKDTQLEPNLGNQPPVTNILAESVEDDQSLVSTPQPEPEPDLIISKKKSKKDKKKNRASSQFDNESSETVTEQPQDLVPSQDTSVDVSPIPEPVPGLSEERSLEQPETEKEATDDTWPTPSKKSKKKSKGSSQQEENTPSTSDLAQESQDVSLPNDEVTKPLDDWDSGFASSKKSKKDKKKRKVLFAGTSDENLLESRLNEAPAETIDNTEQDYQPTVEAGLNDHQDIAAIQSEVVAETTSPSDLPLQFDGSSGLEGSQDIASPNDVVDQNCQDMNPNPQGISESIELPESDLPRLSDDVQSVAVDVTDAALNHSPDVSEPAGQDSNLKSLPSESPAASAEEELPFTKKSKKDKKKRKSKTDDVLGSTGTSTAEESVSLDTPVLESATPNISQDELQEGNIASDTQLVATPEEAKPEVQKQDDLDDWASLPTKKSKKDKKKKKGSQVQNVEPEHVPLHEPQVERSSSPGPGVTSSDPVVADSPNISDEFKTPPEGPPSQASSPTLDQDVAEPLIPEQQNLDEQSKQLMTEDLSADQSQSLSHESETLHPTISEIHDTVRESQGQLSDEPLADHLQSTIPTPEVMGTTIMESQTASEESSPPTQPPMNAGDEDFAPIANKKDKKKKKRRSLAQEPELTRKSSFEEMMDDWQTAEIQPASGQEEKLSPQLGQSAEAQGDEFAETSSKKSKKEKKKKRATRVPSGEYHPTTPSDEDLLEASPASPLPDTSQTSSSQLISRDLGTDESPIATEQAIQSTILEQSNELPPLSQVSEDQLVSNPELMEDIRAITDQQISQNDELSPAIDTEEPLSSGALPILSAQTDLDEQDPTEQLRSLPLEPQPLPDVQLDQGEPTESFTTPKSRKDKKKKKRGSQILIEEPSIVPGEVPAVTPENLDQELDASQNQLAEQSSQPVEPLPIDTEVPTPILQEDSQAAAEEEPFTAKKSKKDKKKKKLTSDWDDDIQQEESQQLGDPESMNTEVTSATPQTEFSTPFTSLKDKDEDPFNFASSKKSKKDKKKKGSSSWEIETPHEQQAPLDENRDASSFEVEPSQNVETALVNNSKEDEFSGFISKKSKKDKKKKRISSWEPEIEPETETATHGEHDSRTDPPLPDSSQMETEIMPSLSEVPTLQQNQVEENEKRQDAPVSSQDSMDISQPVQLDDLEIPNPLDEGDSRAEIIYQTTGDQPAIEEPIPSDSARASQESKHEQQIVDPVIEDLPLTQPGPDITSISEEPISQPSPEEEPELFVTKKSKKDKKKKRANHVQDVESESPPTPLADENPLETPFETPSETPFETPFEMPLLTEPTTIESETINETDLPASRDIQSEDVFPEFVSGKKSKKDKKKKKSGKLQDLELEPEILSSPPVEESSIIQVEQEPLSANNDITSSVEQPPSFEPTSGLSETRNETETPASGEVQTEDAFPEFVTSKKSKKDKKKKRASQSQDWEPESSLASPSQEEIAPIPADVDQGSDEPVAQEDSSVSKDVEAIEDVFPEFSTGNKSKKDKKKKKENQALEIEESESLSTPLEQAQPFYTPLEEVQPILESSNEVLLSENITSVSTDPHIEGLASSRDTQPEEEFPEFLTGKKSKKDKKKKKGAQSQLNWEENITPTPGEEALSIQQPDNELPVTGSLEDGNEAITEMTSTLKDFQPEDEFSEFVSTKKSKKDKKKAKKSESLLTEPERETELSTTSQAEIEASLQASIDPALTQTSEISVAETPVLDEEKQDAPIKSPDIDEVSKGLVSDPTDSLEPMGTFTEAKVSPAKVENIDVISTEASNKISQDADLRPEQDHELGQAEDLSKDAHLEDTSNVVTATPQSQPDDFPEFSSKKSKKDKKKGKKSKVMEPVSWEENDQTTNNQDISKESISSQQPQEDNPAASEPVEHAPILDEHDDQTATLPTPLKGTPTPVVETLETSPAQPIEPEISADKDVEEDMFPVTRKKSKKDKKKQKAAARFDSEPTSGTQTPSIQDDHGQELSAPESLPTEPQDSGKREIVEEPPTQEPLETDIGGTNVSDQLETSQPSVEDLPEFSTKKTKKDKKKRKSAANLESELPSGMQTLSADDTQLSRDITDSVAPLETGETLTTQEPISEEPVEALPVEEEWPPQFSSKKSKKDKKKRKSTSLLQSEPPSGTQTPLVEKTTLDDSLGSSEPALEQTTQEVVDSPPADIQRPASPVEDDWASFTTTKKSKKDKKGKKGKSSGTVTPLDVLQPAAESSQRETSQEASLAEPESSHAKDVWADEEFFKPQESSPGLDSYAEDRHVEIPDENRPGTPRGLSASTIAPALDVDLLPAQLTSHVDHDKPFDQTTQRGKKVRTNTFLGDMEIPEPISTMDPVSTTQDFAADFNAIPNTMTIGDHASQSEQHPSPQTARDIAVDYLSSSHGKQVDVTLTPDDGFSTTLPKITPSREYAVSYLESQSQNIEDIMSEAEHGKQLEVEKSGLPATTPRREIAASYFDPQPELLADNHKGVIVAEYPPKVEEPSTGFEDEIPTPHTARDVAADLMDSRPGKSKRSGKSSPSKKEAEKNDDGSNDADQLAAAAALTGGVAMLADKFGGSKKTKGKKGKKSKYVDKRQPKEDDIFDDPSLWESKERKIVTEGDGGRLDADTGDFWDVPEDAEDGQPEQPSAQMMEEKSTEEQPRGIAHNVISRSLESPESPIVGREETLYGMTESESLTDVRPEQLESQSLDNSKLMRDIDDLDTSEPVMERSMEDDSPRHDIRQQTVSPSRDMDWARTSIMSARSLPPVEEEPHEEELGGNEHAVSRSRDTVRTPEVNRDSGFVTGSPRSARRSLFEDSGQRDSGVHMKDWPEHVPRKREGLSPSNETGARLSWESAESIKATARDVHTPKAEEKKARRSHLGNETPRLSTPTRTARETSPDPEKKDKSHAPETKTPRSGRYQQLGSAGSPALTPHAFGQRSISDHLSREGTPQLSARRSASNTSISRLRTPEPLNFRPESPGGSIRSGANTPPLRRVDKRMSGDLRSLSQHSGSVASLHSPHSAKATDKDHGTAAVAVAAAAALTAAGALQGKDKAADRRASQTFSTPVANEGRVRQRDMTDVYDGVGEGRIGSPRSPTRPHSMRRRQSMQVLELESKVEQLIAENRMLADAKSQADANLDQRAAVTINERDALIEQLRSSLEEYKREVDRLKEVNEGLQGANAQLATQHDQRYSHLELRHASASSELEGIRGNLNKTIQDKDAEIERLRNELEDTKQQVRAMQQQILASKPADADFLRLKDEDHFDHRCQQLCAHAQQWVLRFSKFSDMRASRLTSEINDVKIVDRLDNTVLDGSDVDDYLSDRVRRRDIFMSMTMHMIWEYVFTRYLFGMDREQRQKLKTLEKLLSDVGPPHAVRQWRAVTLTLLSRRPAFGDQRNDDTEAVVQAILETLSKILPPPSNMENQIQSQLRRVLREAVDLSIEMRTQRAEYMMLPPLQPEYDANGDLAETVAFNASLMNERSGSSTSNEDLEAQGAVVRMVLFPLVIKKGDDNGVGDEEIVVCPAQVLVAKQSHRSIRMVTPSSEFGGAPLSRGATPSAGMKSAISLPMSPGSQVDDHMEGAI